MSGRSLADAITFLDDDNEDLAAYSEDEVDIQRYDSEEASDDDTPINDDVHEDFSFTDYTPPAFVPLPKEFELPNLTLDCAYIRPGDVVELVDNSGRDTDHLISGDFLLIRAIVESMKNGDVTLRGYRMRRCAYLQPLFDRKFNDLFMLIEVDEHDQRPRFVQGLEDISPEEVIRKRQCVFTNLEYKLLDTRLLNTHVPARLKLQNEMKSWLFNHGKLICRWVYIVELHRTGKSCGGEARRMFKREAASYSENERSADSPSKPKQKDAPSSDPDFLPHRRTSDNRKRKPSSQEIPGTTKRPQRVPRKCSVLTFGDGYCGCGGTSEGARQAGYKIVWGLEKDSLAMAAYRKNFPEAMHLEMDAHNFTDIARRRIHGCDHLHMSCPCCFWSIAHTSDGKNDDANIATLYTVEAWLKVLKPAMFSLEQAPGLLTLAKHKLFFRTLINGILARGYNVRWRIQDQAWFGVGQHRRRLVFIGAKIGIPLPPFPAPTHGPPKSGLKRYVTIEDSLKVVERQSLSFMNDAYHQPQLEKRLDLQATDPHINLAKCITTSGGDNVHYSGKRANTVRELASFQGFRPDFHFTGSVTEAKKQCGNAWPVKANRAYFAIWAAHREAFNDGLIDAEDEVLDLFDFLETKGITIPKPLSIDVDLLDLAVNLVDDSPNRTGIREPEYRYLPRIEKTIRPLFPLSLWGKGKAIDPLPQRMKNIRISRRSDRMSNDRDQDMDIISTRRRRRIPVYIDDDKEPTWIEESD